MSETTINTAIYRLLRPVARVLLKYNVPFSAFAEIARRAYVDSASQDFKIKGKKQTDSRVAVLTGLNRKEVARLRGLPPIAKIIEQKQLNRAARVIRGWLTDLKYTTKQGEPLELLLSEGSPSFSDLIKDYSGDMPARAVLDELIRVGAVEKKSDGTIKLCTRAYVPQHDDIYKVELMGVAGADLLNTVSHNINTDLEEAFYQRFVSYDNLHVDDLPKIRHLSRQQAQALLEQINGWLSSYDSDVNEKRTTPSAQERIRAGVGVYYFEQAVEQHDVTKTQEPD